MLGASLSRLRGVGVGALSGMGFAEAPASLCSAPSPASGRGKAPSGVIDRSQSTSPAGRADFGKALADAEQERVADLAVGLQLLLAVALDAGGILRRPVLHFGRMGARQFQRPVMRLGGERDDQVEVEPLPILQFLEVH